MNNNIKQTNKQKKFYIFHSNLPVLSKNYMSEHLDSSPARATNRKSRVSQIYNLDKFEQSQITQCRNSIRKHKQNLIDSTRRSECYLNFIYRHFPILEWLPKYQIKSFGPDLIAGITVGVMNIPQVN